MSYFLKKSCTRKKGLYLQIYEGRYDPKTKNTVHESYKVVGYAIDLINQGIADPVAHAQAIVDKLNAELKTKKEKKIGDVSLSKYAGHFLIKNMFDFLGVDNHFNDISISKNFRFNVSDFIRNLCYAQIISPGSKLFSFEKVIPNLYGGMDISYDQILDGINFVGNDYEKFIEVLNHHIEEKFGKRKTNKVYFDCTNYYFEIDSSDEDRQKGPSKENRKDPIIGQALLLDSEQIPIGMKMYPGNCSEKPFLRKAIKELKERYDVAGKIVQVADKGLNCAENIYAAAVESNDGYVFSKTFRGRGLSDSEKKWMLLEDNEGNKWTYYLNSDNKLKYKIKETIDTYDYSFDIKDENDKVIETINFQMKEKRVVSYNAALARKQIIEINREVAKLKEKLYVKKCLKSDLGDGIKYVNLEAFDKNGVAIDVKAVLNQNKIDEALRYAGYNLLVTSEIDKTAEEIYKIYHGLWRIEESFRIMKTQLEARPVYLQKKESIYGHFLICYIALVMVRLIELKLFKDDLEVPSFFNMMRDYIITENPGNGYTNGATCSSTLSKIQKKFGLRKLDTAYLSKKDVDTLFDLHLEDFLS